MLVVEDLVGKYAIVGKNQMESDEYTYEGILTLCLDENKRIVAHWLIGEQEQYGTGFFKNDILVINFYYVGDDNQQYKGVAVYRCLDKNTLDGFWSEKHGDPRYLGSEFCQRIENDGVVNCWKKI